MPRKVIIHRGGESNQVVAFIRLDDDHWGLDRTVGQPKWHGDRAPSWNLVDHFDENCFVKDEFIQSFTTQSGVDPRYVAVELSLVASFTSTPSV